MKYILLQMARSAVFVGHNTFGESIGNRFLGLLLLLSFFSFVTVAQTSIQKPLTINDLLKLSGSGLGSDVLIDAIKTAPKLQIDVSPDGLVEMKKIGLPEKVIRAVLERTRELSSQKLLVPSEQPTGQRSGPPTIQTSRQVAPQAQAVAQTIDQGLENVEFVLFYKDRASGNLVKMEPRKQPEIRKWGNPAGVFSRRPKVVKSTIFLLEQSARVKLDSLPVFVAQGHDLDINSVLVARMDQKPGIRQLDLEKSGTGFGGWWYVPEPGAIVQLEAQRIGPNSIQTSTPKPLEPGEYLLLVYRRREIYDFSVP